MKKILFYPGTFNPPHFGHVSAVEVSLNNINFDEIWIMPSGKRVDKLIPTNYEDRRNLTNLFIEHLQTLTKIPIKLIDSELKDNEGKYTHELIMELKSQSKDDIYQLVGIDGFLGIKEREIGQDEKFIIINRSGYESVNEVTPSSNLTFLEEGVGGISSTKIREMVKVGNQDYKKLLPKEISEYINANNMYIKN